MTYGTPEYYAEQFADLLADVDHANPQYGDALVKGFLIAVDDWKHYHQEQVFEYERVGERVRQTFSM